MDRDRCQRLRLAFDRDPFLGLHRAVQAVAPAPPRHEPPGKLIHNHYLAFLHDVLHVLLEQAIGAQQLRNVVDLLTPLFVLLLDPLPAFFLFRVRQHGGVHFLQCQNQIRNDKSFGVGRV